MELICTIFYESALLRCPAVFHCNQLCIAEDIPGMLARDSPKSSQEVSKMPPRCPKMRVSSASAATQRTKDKDKEGYLEWTRKARKCRKNKRKTNCGRRNITQWSSSFILLSSVMFSLFIAFYESSNVLNGIAWIRISDLLSNFKKILSYTPSISWISFFLGNYYGFFCPARWDKYFKLSFILVLLLLDNCLWHGLCTLR